MFTWALMSREQQLWSRCPSLEWMESGRSCVDDSEKRGRERWHGNPRTRVFTWGWIQWNQVDEHKGLVWEKQDPGEFASHGTAVAVWAPYRSHIKVSKPFKNVKILLRLLFQIFAGSMSLSHPSSFSFFLVPHTVIHFYHSLFIHLLFIFTITQLSRHKNPIPTYKHILKWFGGLDMGPAWSSHSHSCAMGGKLSRILLCSDHGAYQLDPNVSKSLLGHYRFYKSISEVPSFQDVMEKVNLSAQLCVFY